MFRGKIDQPKPVERPLLTLCRLGDLDEGPCLPFGELPAKTGRNFTYGGGSMRLAWLAGGGCGLAPVGDRTD